jgi:hypothetical protein
MKLWLISQTKNQDYDTYDSAVVAANIEEEARKMHPRDGKDIDPKTDAFCGSTWVESPDDVTCEYIGKAKEGTEKGVVCASFNAG